MTVREAIMRWHEQKFNQDRLVMAFSHQWQKNKMKQLMKACLAKKRI